MQNHQWSIEEGVTVYFKKCTFLPHHISQVHTVVRPVAEWHICQMHQMLQRDAWVGQLVFTLPGSSCASTHSVAVWSPAHSRLSEKQPSSGTETTLGGRIKWQQRHHMSLAHSGTVVSLSIKQTSIQTSGKVSVSARTPPSALSTSNNCCLIMLAGGKW